jgi:Zn-finger nucleic acid-binding protein
MSLNCPTCPDIPLSPLRLEPELPAAGCGRCGGALLSLMSWRHWRERQGRVPAAGDADTASTPAPKATDSRSALRCPKCDGFMTKYRFAADSANQIDHCAHCDEVWLDRGEWALLERFAVNTDLGRVISRPFQARVRTDEAKLRQESRYREQFGTDYERARELREWLAAHPKGRDILAYLYLSQTSGTR